MTNNKYFLVKEVLITTAIGLIGCAGIVFSVLYIDTFKNGFFYNNSQLLTSICVAFISVFTVFTAVLFKHSHVFVSKLSFLLITFTTIVMSLLYILKINGVLDKISSVEGVRDYVQGFGSLAVLFFVLLQFFQVLVLPIPSFVLVGAGVLLFGPMKGALLSSFGVILGSLVAFFIGRIFGYKVAKWLIGKEKLDKWLKLIDGKGKVVFAIAFLFPFFPDDILCVVAGITQMPTVYFVIMTALTRSVSIFTSSLSINNSLIPYDTWWGIMLWCVIFVGLGIAILTAFRKILSKSKSQVK